MTNPRRLPRGAHLLMYSSPLLLIVMIITLPSATKTHVALRPANVAHVVTTTTLENTTTTYAPAHSKATNPTTPTTSVAPRAATPVPKRLSAITTNLTVSASASAPDDNVASSEVEGLVSPLSPVAVIPLQGPGIWTITTSSPSVNEMVCASTTRRVESFVALLSAQSCQLQVTSVTSGASLSWLLTPAP